MSNKLTYEELQQRVHASEFSFQEIFKNMSNGVAIYEVVDNGNDFVFKDINPAGAQHSRVQREDVIGKSVRDVFPSIVDFGLFEVLQRVWQTNKPEHHPIALYKDTRINQWVKNYVFKLPTGEIVTVYDDITEAKRTEDNLLTAKKEWENTFDAMDDIITIQDKDMRIVRANKAFHDTFQVELGELNGKHCYEVFRGEDRPCSNCPELLTLKNMRIENTNITHKKLGKVFHVTSSPLLDKKGELVQIVHIATDVTDKKKLEDELFQAHKMEAIGTMAGGIAHDFNNILAIILGYAEMIKDDLPDKSCNKNQINEVLIAAKRAKELVKQILTFSRKGKETQGPLLPVPVIKEALKLMRSSLPSTIEMQQEIALDCGCIIANPTNIHQIVVNLCTNALHAMEDEKGVLTVKLTRVELKKDDIRLESSVSEGAFVELLVTDTGCGMNKGTIKRIFEPYFTTKEPGKGTGIGLSLVYGIVLDCGGFINIESEPNKGASFQVYFPAIKEKVVEVEEEQQESLPRGEERILAVDDEKLMVDLYRATLETLGYKVTANSSSEKTFEAFQDSPNSFDLVITDQTMPHLTGSELAKKILRIRPDIPIIICTGYSSLISRQKAAKIGIERFVMKPISRRDLAITVREVLDRQINQERRRVQ